MLWMIKIEEELFNFTDSSINVIENVFSNDLLFLTELNLMDYSLLIIIIKLPGKDTPEYLDIINYFGNPSYFRRLFKSKNEKFIYCLGIIDYLQKFNLSKFFENKYKSLLYGSRVKYVSAVDPVLYSDRIFDFCHEYVFVSS